MRIAWTILVAGVLFAGCQSNSGTDKKAAPATVAYKDNGDDATLSSGSNLPGTTVASTTSTAAITDNSNGCVIPAKKVAQRSTAYNWRRHTRKHVTKTVVETETTVAATQPEPLPEPIKEPAVVVTQPEQITVEKPATFTGNIPAAAPAKRARVHLSPEAGGTLNNLYKMAPGYQTSNMLKVGFSAGVMVNVELGKHFAFEPGVRYIMKGAELTSTSNDAGVKVEHKDKLTFHYVEAPVNLVYYTDGWGTNRFMVGAGPYVSYLANAQDKTKDKIYGPDGIVEVKGQHVIHRGDPDETGKIRNFDAGANAFIGYQMKSGVYVKGGAEVGLLDLQKHSNNTLGQGGFYDRNPVLGDNGLVGGLVVPPCTI